jgi:hypothetical protein
MKFAFLLSGAFGFVLVTAVGLASDRALDLVLRDAALACLATAWLGRWFWRRLDEAFALTLAARRAAARARDAAQPAQAPAPAMASPAPSPAASLTPPSRR